MSKVLRLMLMVIGVVVALAPALVPPEWTSDLGLETWGAKILADHSRHTDAELTQMSEALNRRTEKKERVIKKLIDGQITLFKTATLFRRWNKQYPRWPNDPLDGTTSEEEQICYQVIQWARNHLWMYYPEWADEFASRLKDELRRHKAEHGRVVLPEVSEWDEYESS